MSDNRVADEDEGKYGESRLNGMKKFSVFHAKK